MAILFEWYENPVAPNQPQEETKLHARITLNGKTGTDRLRRKIQERCSLTETDVSAVLDALSHAMGEELAEGRQVHLDGIGYFHPTLLHGRNKRRYKTEEYESKAERHQIPGGSGSEE
jgi:predicted histone-like DNA-binding protein